MITRLTIRVTAQHIAAGRIGNEARCPIALALCEQHPRDGGSWRVDGERAYVVGVNQAPFSLSRRACEFVLTFDTCRDLATPATFRFVEEVA